MKNTKARRKRFKRVRAMLLPLVYKYPYNHHKPMPDFLIKAIAKALYEYHFNLY
jgi:hypothetical protein